MTVLILQHTFQLGQRSYFIQLLAEEWERRGVRVLFHHGTKNCPAADVLILHVNLSVVPPEYLKVAARYPIVINGKIANIRKTAYSKIRVMPGDGYEGEVIVKSADNYAGIPERKARAAKADSSRDILRRFTQWMRGAERSRARGPGIMDKTDYRVFPRRELVPEEWFAADDVIVEQFRPERHGDQFILREWYFLGESEWLSCEISDEPIFTTGDVTDKFDRHVPPEIRLARKELCVDYGKIDYAFGTDGKPVLYDVNKTVGVWSWASLRLPAMVEALAPGLFFYTDTQRPA